MTDTIQVQRPQPTDSGTWDDTLGIFVPASPTDIYSGRASVSSKGWTPREQVSAGADDTVTTDTVNVPIGSPEFEKGDLVTVLTSLRSTQLVNKQFVVKASVLTTYEIQQKSIIELWDVAAPR